MPAKSNRSFHRSASLKLALPATSANLGPAFDTAALALGLFLKIRAHVSDQFSITARGRDADLCAQLENHLILTTYSEILQRESKRIQPLALHIENEIPIGKGCGSSAAARLAGIALAVHFGALRWDEARIVGEASWREHHPDNAAACWYGGLAIARMSGEAEAQVASIVPKGKWLCSWRFLMRRFPRSRHVAVFRSNFPVRKRSATFKIRWCWWPVLVK